MKTKIETITPTMAKALLENNLVPERQRRPSESTVNSYARAMRSGQWLLTHQGIAIDDAGELIDGMHRLMAIVQSGTPVRMMVTTGLPHTVTGEGMFTIDAIDRGRERRIGEQLKLRHGMTNASLLAATCRGILWLCSFSMKSLVGKMTVANVMRVLDVYGDEVNYAITSRSRDIRVRNASVISASAFAMKALRNPVRDFYNRLTTGEDIKDGDPSLTCRRWLMNSTDKTGSLIEYRAVLTCAMKHVTQEKMTKLYDTEHGYKFFLEKQRESVNKLLASCGFSD